MATSERDRAIEDPLLRQVLGPNPGLWFTAIGLIAVIGFAGYQWSRQLSEGMVVAGMNRPVYWGLYITNYVFFIGISHAGTLISAILRLTQAEWRRPITRCAEAITVFALLMGSSNVLWHLGRPELIYVPLLYPQPLSPLIWDVVCISIYFVGSLTYLYLPMIPDMALLRDRGTRLRWMYRALALGWQGTERQQHRLENLIGFMAVAIIPIAVSVHTVVSWVFAMSIQPMWHSAIFGPYFVVGAIFSGIGALIVAMAVLRRVFKLEAFFQPIHFSNLGLLMLTMACLWFYFTFAEHMTVWYGNEPDEMAVFNSRVSGQFALPFWTMVTCCFVIPLGILSFSRFRTVTGTVIASVAVLIGMWLERFIIVLSTSSYPRVESAWDLGTYTPSLVELSITAGEFACFALLYIIFSKLFPLVSVWEVKEGDQFDHVPDTPAGAEPATSG